MDYLTDARQEYNISLRVVRFELSPGSYENLITNLPDHEFDMDDFFCSEIAFNVEIEQNGRKYEYQMNYSEAVKICRSFLRIHDGKSVMDAEGLISSNIEAVRPGRTFPRQKRFKIPMSFCYRN